MRVVTANEIREMDRKAMADFAMPGEVLMENAGAAVVEAAHSLFGTLRGKRAAIFCGAGNNGGDGYVTARRLLLLGALPVVFMLASEDQLKGDALIHYTALKRAIGADIRDFGVGGASIVPGQFDLVIDALLGTGLKNAPREAYAAAIACINGLGRSAPVIAVDIPSGVDSDTGAVPGEAVMATITVTFACPKLGLYLFPGSTHAGELHVSDIGFDWSQIAIDTACSLVDPASFGNLLRSRPAESNKGDYGHVGIIAGSRGMAGAPTLAARAAQRAGAGLVTVLTAESVQPMVAVKLDEQMTVPLSEVDGAAALASFDKIAEAASRFTVLCIGPGLTTHPGTVQLVQRILQELAVPIVLDADGLNALALHPDAIKTRMSNTEAPLILTPHPGEAARLLGTSIAAVESNRVDSVRELARRYGATALLKGRYTLISNPEGVVRINTTGNPGMASGGMGDTLTGITGALLAQQTARAKRSGEASNGPGEIGLLAASAGAYLHGLAGDMAATKRGEAGLVAGDIIEILPEAIRALQQGRIA